MKQIKCLPRLSQILAVTLASLLPLSAHAFCGFYVGQAGASLYNDASKVVLVRDGDQTTLTMANDFSGNVSNFAMVVPVPYVLGKDDIQVSESRLIDHLDAYTAPRLVEYFDPDPCRPQPRMMAMAAPAMAEADFAGAPQSGPEALGVTIEAQYSVGEYEILILSAEQSSGLQTWLSANGYAVPAKARAVLSDYIAAGMKFFVAKVALDRVVQSPSGEAAFLSPLQLKMRSQRLMLPIRLGMVNARGEQELFVYAITRSGRVEAANYDNRRIPSDIDIPPFTEKLFSRFYKDMFTRQVAQTNRPTIFTEYTWDMSWCDPCAANPPSVADLTSLGVSWLAGDEIAPPPRPGPIPQPLSGTRGSAGGTSGPAQPAAIPLIAPGMAPPMPQAIDAFVTRLHVRYSSQTHKQDILFRVTDDRENFQGRYVMRQPFLGETNCAAGQDYRNRLGLRQAQERGALNFLTGWPVDYIAEQQSRYPGKPASERK